MQVQRLKRSVVSNKDRRWLLAIIMSIILICAIYATVVHARASFTGQPPSEAHAVNAHIHAGKAYLSQCEVDEMFLLAPLVRVVSQRRG